MNGAPMPDRSELPLDVLDALDRVCDRYEAAWARGGRPRVEDYLGGLDAAYRPALLRALLAAELHARGHRGERPEPGEYHARFPGDRAERGGVRRRGRQDRELQGLAAVLVLDCGGDSAGVHVDRKSPPSHERIPLDY